MAYYQGGAAPQQHQLYGPAVAQQQYYGQQQQQQQLYAGSYAQQAPAQQQLAYSYGQPGANGASTAVLAATPQQLWQVQQAQQAPRGNVVVPTPGHRGAAAPLGAWTTGLYDCCDDGVVCCMGYALTSVLYGEIYRKVTNDSCVCPCLLYHCCWCFACCFANKTREALRNKYNLPAEPCGDCCVHCWCSSCALCQEHRELRAREGWKTWP